jgi:hypothetical protein
VPLPSSMADFTNLQTSGLISTSVPLPSSMADFTNLQTSGLISTSMPSSLVISAGDQSDKPASKSDIDISTGARWIAACSSAVHGGYATSLSGAVSNMTSTGVDVQSLFHKNNGTQLSQPC